MLNVQCVVFGPGSQQKGEARTATFSRVPAVGEHFTLLDNEMDVHYRVTAVTHLDGVTSDNDVVAEIRGTATFPMELDAALRREWEAFRSDVQQKWYGDKELTRL